MKRTALVASLLLAAFPASWGCRGQEPTAVGAVVAVPVESDDGARERLPHSHARRVIWLGLDGLDWDHLDALAATGLLPNWSRLAREGFDARLSAFGPILSPTDPNQPKARVALATLRAPAVAPDQEMKELSKSAELPRLTRRKHGTSPC